MAVSKLIRVRVLGWKKRDGHDIALKQIHRGAVPRLQRLRQFKQSVTDASE